MYAFSKLGPGQLDITGYNLKDVEGEVKITSIVFDLFFLPMIFFTFPDISSIHSADKCIAQTGDQEVNCVLPFTLMEKTFHNCTWYGAQVGTSQPRPWCATRTDQNGKTVQRGECTSHVGCDIPGDNTK